MQILSNSSKRIVIARNIVSPSPAARLRTGSTVWKRQVFASKTYGALRRFNVES